MKQVVGFTNVYYTLWDYEAVPQYRTDSYGNHHHCGTDHKFYYIKNISIDLQKVKAQYPNLPLDESLRGKTSSFSRNEKVDLPNNIFWGGKYTGKLIDEILISDFKYCMWAMENYNQVHQYVSQHPIYLEHLAAIEKAKSDLLDGVTLIKVGDEVEVTFERNGFNADDDYTTCMVDGVYGEVRVTAICSGVRPVDGMYPYLMPIINGKAQRTKNKTVKVKVLEVINTQVTRDGEISQFIKIA